MAFPFYTRIFHLFLTIPSSIILIILPVKYFLNVRLGVDAFLTTLSSFTLVLGGIYLRYGSPAFFHLFEFTASIGFLFATYIMVARESGKIF